MGRTKGSEAGNLSVTKRGSRGGKDRAAAAAIAKSGFDGSLIPPWRKTVSIFKQPVTLVHTTSRETKNPTNEQLRRAKALNGRSDKPRQLFWAKSLEGLYAMAPVCNPDRIIPEKNEHIQHRLDLVDKMTPAFPMIGRDACAASLCSALNGLGESRITGQVAPPKRLELNPCVHINTEQPLIKVSLFSKKKKKKL
ncbi:unnamed protein product [Gongylonema pulchrum]|uniref:Methyl-CpG-binding domain protein 2 n=1 Tax=Gongylonema pulchrum TaxID=637853 RepID=A0A183D906_9BILA|nr:unnamed protein product [Gongylonema pulchrum]VDK49635.1 unnamed protein product [Gongylonema pulchrum]